MSWWTPTSAQEMDMPCTRLQCPTGYLQRWDAESTFCTGACNSTDAEMCCFRRGFASHSWRILASSAVSESWDLAALRFYLAENCSAESLIETVPDRRSGANGAAFSHHRGRGGVAAELFHEPIRLPSSAASSVKWSSGAPCAAGDCFVGFSWESDGTRQPVGNCKLTRGTCPTVGYIRQAGAFRVGCVEVEQSSASGFFADTLRLQLLDLDGPTGAADMTSRPQPRRRVVIKRKVSSSTYERHKAQMENLGLDPSDPLPPQSEQLVDLAEDELDAPDPELSPPHISPNMALPARGQRLSTSSQVLPPKAKERKSVSLKTRTLEEQIIAKRYDRALDRFAQQQEEWEKFRHHASRKTGRDKEELVVTRAEEYRERLEVMELLDRATPEEIKSGGFNWYHSLRGGGARFIQVGNMFSGLYLPMKLHKEKFVHEIIRKPLLVDLTTARHTAEASGKKKPRSWRDDEYLLTRIRKYGAKMKELAPGQLEYDELMEPEVHVDALQTRASEGLGDEELMAALLEEGTTADNTMPLEKEPLTSAAAAPIAGPHAEVTPSQLHFQADVKTTCTRTIRLRNTGSAAIQFEWLQNAPRQGFQAGQPVGAYSEQKVKLQHPRRSLKSIGLLPLRFSIYSS
ncbi:ssp2 [Symbiodinium pilosum]|uniref:Ssp2 protein n=1 Tax=Symbiodinium pilosum TaxID=2952 RepID=A0A812MGS4_SYMPI|nr:ssp2 [Symbiodinium pilosum]